MMKRYLQVLLVSLMTLGATVMGMAADELTLQLQKGLLEEEAHQNYGEALKAYQAAVAAYDTNRQAAATAVFRLAETYRKLGKTNEARAQYERVVIEFADQTILVGAASKQLQIDFGEMASPAPMTAGGLDDATRNRLQDELHALEAQLAFLKKSDEEQRFTALSKLVPDNAMSVLMKERNELSREKAVKSKNFAPQHPEIVALDTALKENNRRLKQESETLLKRLEEKARVYKEQLSGVADKPLENSAPSVSAQETAEIAQLKLLLKNSPDLLNAKSSEDGMAPLHRAAQKGNLEVAKYLLANGAKVNLPMGGENGTPLYFAAANGHKAMVELLLQNGAEVDLTANNGATPLLAASARAYDSVVQVLLAHGAQINAEDINGLTALYLAVGKGDVDLVRMLLENKAEVARMAVSTATLGYSGRQTGIRWTALHRAASKGDVPMLKLLLSAVSDVDLQDQWGRTPLHIAVAEGKQAAVELLLAHKAGVNAKTSDGKSPLLLATDACIAEKLLQAGAEVGARTQQQVDSLNQAVNQENRALVAVLLKHGADPNVVVENVMTPLLLAVSQHSSEIVKLLLEARANPNQTSEYSTSGGMDNRYPLQVAVGRRDTDVVELLLKFKADARVRDQDGYTLLHYAVANLDVRTAGVLLKHKPDIDAYAKNGLSALMLAQSGYSGNLCDRKIIFTGPNSPTAAPPLRLGFPRSVPGLVPAVNLPPVCHELEELLIAHGADIYSNRRPYMIVSRSGKANQVIFRKDAAGVNRFSLFELLICCYAGWQYNYDFAFPDFSQVTIDRLEGNQPKRLTLNLVTALETGDATADVWLEWGDVVELPELDHSLSQTWSGLAKDYRETLSRSCRRKVTLTVKGKTQEIEVVPEVFYETPRGVPRVATSLVTSQNSSSCHLSQVVFGSKMLLASSDTRQVKVIRKQMDKGGIREMTYDIGKVQFSPDDLWLRGGDVIEVPEKE